MNIVIPFYPSFGEFDGLIEEVTGERKPVTHTVVEALISDMLSRRRNANPSISVGNAIEAAITKHGPTYRSNVELSLRNGRDNLSFGGVRTAASCPAFPVEALEFANEIIAEAICQTSHKGKSVVGQDQFEYDQSEKPVVICRRFIDFIEHCEELGFGNRFIVDKRELLILDRCYDLLNAMIRNTGTKVGA